jgi:hypothetical protein
MHPLKNIIVTLLVLAVLGAAFFVYKQARYEPSPEPADEETMSLTLYVQDKAAAQTSDCGVTVKIARTVPKTIAVADASLKILFKDELARYGTYQSVSIENGVAKVMLASETMQALSSCEAVHLTSVLEDTLTQYPSIRSVEVHSPSGKVEF